MTEMMSCHSRITIIFSDSEVELCEINFNTQHVKRNAGLTAKPTHNFPHDKLKLLEAV
jgi:hypothetical protein